LLTRLRPDMQLEITQQDEDTGKRAYGPGAHSNPGSSETAALHQAVASTLVSCSFVSVPTEPEAEGFSNNLCRNCCFMST